MLIMTYDEPCFTVYRDSSIFRYAWLFDSVCSISNAVATSAGFMAMAIPYNEGRALARRPDLRRGGGRMRRGRRLRGDAGAAAAGDVRQFDSGGARHRRRRGGADVRGGHRVAVHAARHRV